jgi:hypothetical protein
MYNILYEIIYLFIILKYKIAENIPTII